MHKELQQALVLPRLRPLPQIDRLVLPDHLQPPVHKQDLPGHPPILTVDMVILFSNDIWGITFNLKQ